MAHPYFFVHPSYPSSEKVTVIWTGVGKQKATVDQTHRFLVLYIKIHPTSIQYRRPPQCTRRSDQRGDIARVNPTLHDYTQLRSPLSLDRDGQ